MKNLFAVAVLILFTSMSFAFEPEVIREEFYANGTPKLQFIQISKSLVKATYFFENGAVSESGFFRDEKLYGYWETFDFSKNKIASGSFNENQKVGVWNYWNNGDLIQSISYSESLASR